jgi:hypothetical protein
MNSNWGYVMDAKVSHKPCSCSSFKNFVHTSGAEDCTALSESFILD